MWTESIYKSAHFEQYTKSVFKNGKLTKRPGMKLFHLIFASAAAITATISNQALNSERYKMRRKLGNKQRGNIQRAWQRQRGYADQPTFSVANFATAMTNFQAKLEQRQRAMATFERMMATVATYRS